MKKKIAVMILIFMLTCVMFTGVALAADIINLSTLGPARVTVTGEHGIVEIGFTGTSSASLTLYSVYNTTIMFKNAKIISNENALKYQSGNSILKFEGTSTLSSGNLEDGVGVDTPGNATLEIQGDGVAYVTGRESGSGIGQLGTVNITGGTIFASGGNEKDVDCNILTISGDAALFLEHGHANSTIPSTTHTYWEYASASDVPAGYSVPSDWSYPIGAYLNLPNAAPSFTVDATNTSQTLTPGGSLTAMKVKDPNGLIDIASFTVKSGSLPTGVTLNNDGAFTCAANISAGSYTATIEVADVGGLTATTTLNITVSNVEPYFTSDAQNTSQTIAAGDNIAQLIAQDPNGASDIVSFTVISGSLPTGIILNNDGTFSGVASAGNYTATIEVRDAGGLTDTTILNVTVNDILVTVTPETVTLGYSETCTVTAKTEPTGKTIEYYSSNPSVATVDINTGVVTAQSKQGRVIIEAMSESGSDECVIYVVDKSEPAPKPSDPLEGVMVQIKDDMGNPRAGLYVTMLSDPQTVMTDSNGVAVFKNVPYNTNDPHMLIIQDFRGMELGAFNLRFISGSAPSSSVAGNDIDITFNNTIRNTILNLTTREGSVQDVAASFDTKPVEKVENPQTGEDIKPSWWWIFICLVPIILYSKKKHCWEDRY